MSDMVGYCGYRCHLCAARSDDPVVRQKLVDGWKKYFGHENYTAENVKCDGCRSDGRVADQQCKARPCAIERGVESCADCEDFPCGKVKSLLATGTGMIIFCYPGTGELSREEYDLCMRQFNSMPGLVRALAERGRAPSWLREAKLDDED
jgi:hypothetical protein